MLLKDLPLGAYLDVPVSSYQNIFGSHIQFWLVDKNHTGYPSNSATFMSRYGLFTCPYDAKEPNGEPQGSGRYKTSNIRQWLNSAAPAGEWYTPQHPNDTPPTEENSANHLEYASWPGFLAIVSENFRSSLLQTSISAAFGEDGAPNDTMKDLVFLPSAYEIGGAKPYKLPVDGVKFELLDRNNYRAKGTAQNGNQGEYIDYYTRSCRWPDSILSITKINAYSETDYFTYRSPYFGAYFRPVCNISGDKEIIPSTMNSGHYMLKENPPEVPSISAPSSGKKIYNDRPRFLLTLGAASEIYLNQTIDARGYTPSRQAALSRQKIVLRKSESAQPGTVNLTLTTHSQFSDPSPAASISTTYAAPAYTDNPIKKGGTRIKAMHINEIRAMVNDVRAYYGLSPIIWSESVIAHTTPIRNWRAHVLEIRSAIDEVIVYVNGWDETNSVNDIHAPSWIALDDNLPRADAMEQLRSVLESL